MAANAQDLAEAKDLSAAMADRLRLDDARIEGIARGLEDVAALPDPIGAVIAEWSRPNGLHIARIRVPLGVIGIIYESRPNVTADAGGLCLKRSEEPTSELQSLMRISYSVFCLKKHTTHIRINYRDTRTQHT